jgi:AcrR family transcriptional regulator
MKTQPARRQAARLPREVRIAELMTAARAVFKEKGYADALTTDIAERAGVVEGTIYRYFDTKRDLLIKVLEQWYQEMISDFDRELRHVSGTWNRLRFMIWRHLSVLHQEPQLCQLVLLELRSDADYPGTAVFRMNREYTHRTLEIVAAAMASGEFRTGVPLSLVRDMIYGGIEHQSWAYLRGLGNFSPDDVADSLADMIYRALATEPQSNSQPGMAGTPERLSRALDRLDRVADRLEHGLGPATAK